MKKKAVYLLSIIGIFFVVLALTSTVFSEKQDNRITAFNNSISYAEKNNLDKAITELTNIYSQYAGDYLINLRLGYLYYLTKKYDESIKYYTKAIEVRDGNTIEAYLGLTLPFAGKEKWEEVVKIYHKILALDENNYTANLRLGQIFLNRKDYTNADKYLARVFKAYPSDYEANLSYGWNLFYLGRKSEAKERFVYVLMLSKNDASATEGLKLVN